MIMAVGILGKPGFAFLKQRLYRMFKKIAPPDQVGIVRYRIGLVLFTLPILIGWLLPYFNHLLPEYEFYKQNINVTGDLIFVSSFFVLGGDFWDKIRGLFVHRAKMVIETPEMGNRKPEGGEKIER
jgi:hypothetical protein